MDENLLDKTARQSCNASNMVYIMHNVFSCLDSSVGQWTASLPKPSGFDSRYCHNFSIQA